MKRKRKTVPTSGPYYKKYMTFKVHYLSDTSSLHL